MTTVQTVKTLPFLLFVGQGEFLLYETAKWFICSINILKPRQNGRHFADDIFKCIFLNEYVWISIKIPLKSVPGGPPINIVPTLVMIMAWRRPGEKPLSEPMLVRLPTQWKSPFCSVESYVGSLDKVHGVVTIRNTPVICWSRGGGGGGGVQGIDLNSCIEVMTDIYMCTLESRWLSKWSHRVKPMVLYVSFYANKNILNNISELPSLQSLIENISHLHLFMRLVSV